MSKKKDYDFFQKHLEEYLSNPIYRDKHAIIADERLQGIYDTFETAYHAAAAHFLPGHFIIQEIVDDRELTNFIFLAFVVEKELFCRPEGAAKQS